MQSSNVCPVCNASFSRRDNMLRHQINKHSEITENFQPRIQYTHATLKEPSIMTSTPLNRPQFKFQHPCSILLTGPSGSGKTVLTKNIICDKWIDDPLKELSGVTDNTSHYTTM